MPPHSSHLLQPLDVGLFGPLKRAYGKLIKKIMVAGNNHIDKQDFLPLSSCSQSNKEKVLEKITFRLHTPTPPPLSQSSSSSVLQTPQNTRQLDRKIRSLQRSLNKKRQLSSSPTSHLRHLENAAQMAMNMNQLLHQEMKSLRTENERKAKKRARGNAVLGTDTILSIQEGQDRVQQLNLQANSYTDEIPRQRAPPRC
ncbi:hypothetical protein PHISCL_03083, partial [Aspergillus sclerotialis]